MGRDLSKLRLWTTLEPLDEQLDHIQMALRGGEVEGGLSLVARGVDARLRRDQLLSDDRVAVLARRVLARIGVCPHASSAGGGRNSPPLRAR